MQALLFPGQGIQRRGMGAGLFEEFPELTAAADDVLGYSVAELCTTDRQRHLRDTRYAQPAIFFVNALAGLKKTGSYGAFAGHSLGEYNALVAAGYLDLLTALDIVRQRGELMASVTGGGMAAVVGPPGPVVARVLRDEGFSKVFMANRNADTQSTIAGDVGELAQATKALAALPNARVLRLNVSGPFHTPLMEPAGAALAEILATVTPAPVASAPDGTPPPLVVSSVTGEPVHAGTAVDALARQVCAPVEWIRAVKTLRGHDVTRFDEVNGTTLRSLIDDIR